MHLKTKNKTFVTTDHHACFTPSVTSSFGQSSQWNHVSSSDRGLYIPLRCTSSGPIWWKGSASVCVSMETSFRESKTLCVCVCVPYTSRAVFSIGLLHLSDPMYEKAASSCLNEKRESNRTDREMQQPPCNLYPACFVFGCVYNHQFPT